MNWKTFDEKPVLGALICTRNKEKQTSQQVARLFYEITRYTEWNIRPCDEPVLLWCYVSLPEPLEDK